MNRDPRRAHPLLRLLLGLVGTTLLGTSLLVIATPGVAPAEGRAVSVEPAEGLANQVIRVSWTGFRPTTAGGDNVVIILQCSGAPTSLGDCFTADPYPAVAEGNRQIGRTAADGTGSALFEVRGAAQLPQLGCSASVDCSILVFENDGAPVPPGTLPGTSIVAPLRFAPSQADCPQVEDFDLRADGAASAAPLFYRWAALRCGGSSPLVLDFTETSSNEGRENFLAGLVDLGLTSAPATDEELEAHPDAGAYSYAPIDLTAVAVVMNMRDPFTGRRLEDVVLTPRLVAMLVTDSDVTRLLTDPELRQLNPGVRFPTVALAHPLVRAERNADTRLVTRWFSSDPGAAGFLAGDDAFGATINPAYRGYAYPKDLFENVAQSAQFLPRAGQNQVALRMFYAVRPTGSTSERTDEIGFLGIVDLPTAERFGLPTAKIVNASGAAVEPTEESILAGYRAMVPGESGVLEADVVADAAEAYPLVKVDYAMVADVPATPAKRDSLRDLLTYAVGDGQENLPPGYVRLPEALVKQTLAIAERLAPDDATPPPSTTTPESPGPDPLDLGGAPEALLPFESSFGSGFGDLGAVPGTFASDGLAADGTSGAETGGAKGDDDGDSAGTAGAEGPELPALPVGSSGLLVPVLGATTGLGMVGWSAAGLQPRLGSARRRLLGGVA